MSQGWFPPRSECTRPPRFSAQDAPQPHARCLDDCRRELFVSDPSGSQQCELEGSVTHHS